MGRKKCWKICVGELMYGCPGLNRTLLCLTKSFAEVCTILNTGTCRRGAETEGACRHGSCH